MASPRTIRVLKDLKISNENDVRNYECFRYLSYYNRSVSRRAHRSTP